MYRKKIRIHKRKFYLEVPESLVGKDVEIRIMEQKQRVLPIASQQNDTIQQLLVEPLQISGFQAMTREEIYDK